MRYKINRLVVTGYERLALSDDKSLDIDAETIHLILGTNGCGKSSIMDLLTPLPPNRKYFTEDGSKHIELTTESGDRYVVYSQGTHHTIYRNNEVLYKDIGLKMCTSRINELFGITINDHRFMLGKSSMVTMSLQQRKEFISNISSIDFDYVNGLYSNLNRRLRDAQGVIRHINNRILALKDYVLSDNAMIDSLLKREKEIKELIYSLYELKRPDVSLETHNLSVKWLSKVQDRVSELRTDLTNLGVDDANTLTDTANVLRNDLKPLLTESNTIEESLLEISRSVTSAEAKVLIDELDNRLGVLNNNRIIDNTNITQFTIFDRVRLHDMLNSLYGDIVNYEATDLDRLNKTLTEAKKTYSDLSDSIDELDSKHSVIRTKLSVYESVDGTIVCPECNTSIDSSNVKHTVDELMIESDKIMVDKEALVADRKVASETIAECTSVLDGIKAVYSKALQIGLTTIIPTEMVMESSTRVLQMVNDVSTLDELNRLIAKRDELVINTLDDGDRYELLTKRHDTLSADINKVQSKLRVYDDVIARHVSISGDLADISLALKKANESRKNGISNSRNKSMDELISLLKEVANNTVTEIDHMRHSIKEHKSLVDELESVTESAKIYTILMKELNPSTGLIATSVKSFLTSYISDVNDIIASVWSYDLVVLPYDTKDLEKGITYRFPVRTRGEDNAEDIADTSESMREIISLAFRLTSLKYMNLLGCPLMIDEFGRSMDEVHLIKSYDLLESLSNEHDIQMFIIAHIKACYNRFRSSGMTIISSLNLDSLE